MTRTWSKLFCGAPRKNNSVNVNQRVNAESYWISRVVGNRCPYALQDVGIKGMDTHPIAYPKGKDPREGFGPMTTTKKLPANSEILGKMETLSVNDRIRVDGNPLTPPKQQFIVNGFFSCPCMEAKPSFSEKEVLMFQNHPATNNAVVGEVILRTPIPLNSKCPDCLAFWYMKYGNVSNKPTDFN